MKMNTCPACHGRRWMPNSKTGEPCECPICYGNGVREPPYDRLPFWYVINVNNGVALGANASIDGALQIEPRADFEAVAFVATSTGIFRTSLRDASGRTYQNDGARIAGAAALVDNANQWGTAQDPFYFLAPFILPMRTNLQHTFEDTSGAPNTIQAALAGFELYPLQ